MKAPGKLIVFEGPDGTGKSTQIKKLATKLAADGKEVLMLREPGGTQLGETLRAALKHSTENISPRAELLGMNCSRAQLVDTVIKPALAAGKWVLLDRFFYSTIAYQGYGKQLPIELVNAVIKAATGDLTPDHVFLLHISIEESLRRRQEREANLPFKDQDRFEQQQIDFFIRVGEGYEAIAKANPELVHKIDATKTIDEVHTAIWTYLN
jgi:dTMP kinase